MTNRIIGKAFLTLVLPAALIVGSARAALSSATAGDGCATRITVMEQALVQGDPILLGDISEIEGGDPNFIRTLRSIVIGKAPLPKQTRQIQKEYVEIRLKQNRIDPSLISLAFPQICTVSRDYIEIQTEEIERILRGFILEKQIWGEDGVSIKTVQGADNLVLPRGKVSYQVISPKPDGLIGTIPLSVNFYVDGSFQKRVWSTVRVEAPAEVVFTGKPLRRLQPVGEDDVILKVIEDRSELPSDYIGSVDDVLGKRAKRKIGAGVILRADHVEVPPLVNRGDLVSVIAESDRLRITTTGIVRESGHRGSMVRVVNLDSNKEIYARVMDASTVRVDF